MWRLVISLFFLFVVDRLTKLYFLQNPPQNLGGGFFDLHINENIAFSLPLTVFILYPLIFGILVILIFLAFKAYKAKSILVWPWSIMIMGALSNILDRFRYGGVIDFISVPYFTVFNLSDVYIFLSVVWIFWYQIKEERKSLTKKSD